ncbi:MAG: hypothetical protein ABI895_03640 [Deltaproteobacteria bacterium]
MTLRLSSLCALLLALGCSSETKLGKSSEPVQASAALQALTAKDETAVAQCGHAVQNCEQQLPDAAGAAVCQRLAQHCGELQEHLSEARSHVVGCLNGVQACQEHAPEQAQCSRDVTGCDPLARGAQEDRDTVIQCSDKVQACLTRVATLPVAAAVSCENIATACERVSAQVAEAGRERAEGSSSAEEHAKKAHDAMAAIGEEAGDDDQDEDADEVAEAKENTAHGGAARSHQTEDADEVDDD